MNRVRGRLTEQQEQEYRQVIENYRLLEADLTQPNRETRLLELDNQFHRKAFEITGMEAHFDHMLGELQHVERIRKFSLQTNENKSVCAATLAFWKCCCTAPPMNWAKRWKAT